MAFLKELAVLYTVFFKIGLVTFGGGLTMLPMFERILVKEKNWVSMDEILDYYSIAQTTPGIIAVNVATFVGHKRAGSVGGIFATLGMVTPSVIIITLIAKFISNFEQIEAVQKAMKGINAAVAALLAYAVFNLCKRNLTKLPAVLLFCASFAAVYFLHAHIVLVVLTGAFIGAVIFFASKHGERR
ncbi:chromate transporter [Treponema sp.]|uniref:chromate transporter n=1 Tax=Treponema sp. TaxID=166 RepID=UPI003EFD710A